MSFCLFEISKLVSPQFLLFSLFCFRAKNGEKTLQLTSINFVELFLICQWCKRMYLFGFVALYVGMFVARANKVEGTIS